MNEKKKVSGIKKLSTWFTVPSEKGTVKSASYLEMVSLLYVKVVN